MAKNLGTDVSYTFDNEGYNYDSVVYQAGKPILDAELNLQQQLQENLTRKVALNQGSGWVSFREPYAKPGITEAFYTQDPSNTIPEMAVVNGWPVYVTGTHDTRKNVNKVDMSEFPLVAGARADGVFLEVWRGLIDDQTSGITTPTDITVIGALRTVCTVNANLAWAAGDNGVLLKTDSSGVTWKSQPSPTSYTIRAIKFITETVGFLAGDNGMLYKTENAGLSWDKISLPVADSIYDMDIVSDTLMVLVGSKGTVLRSTDMENFILVDSTGQATEDLLSVNFYTEYLGWACGANGVYLRTIDGGLKWDVYNVYIPDPSDKKKLVLVTEQLNSVSFSNMSDGWMVGNNGLILRTTDGGNHWADISNYIFDDASSTYGSTSNDLNRIEIVPTYPLQVTMSIRNPSVIYAVTYTISPTQLILSYATQADPTTSIDCEPLTLAEYATDEELVTAINNVKVDGLYLVDASLSYTSSSYTYHSVSGTVKGSESLDMKFSLGDVAWIAGDNGTMLYTSNGGARWKVVDAKASFDLYGISFLDISTGWVVGDEGEISSYLSSRTNQWEEQDTNLVKQVQRKVYPYGNLSAPATLFLANDSIHPDIKVETTARTQIQYRIRVVEAIDIQNFRDSGLGAPYVFSKGPNSTVIAAGSYPYENMGAVNGDYTLWRAPCRNTVDGFSYAIPMFVVSRRNKQAYNPMTNVNGSSDDSLNAIRPDGLIYEDIVSEDILDVRRKILDVSTSELLGRSFDDLLKGTLNTSMINSPTRGGQIGSLLTYVDELAGTAMEGFYTGNFNSQAIPGVTAFAGDDPNGIVGITGYTPTNALFTPLVDGMYHHSPDYYSATYVSTDSTTAGLNGQDIPGFFTGMGTTQAQFVFYGESGIAGAGVNYKIQGAYIDYHNVALSRTPNKPLQVKNYSAGNPLQSVSYNGIGKGVESQIVRQLATGVGELYDYVEMTAESFGEEAKVCGSKVRLHIYREITENTTTLTVPKNIEGFFIMGIHRIINVSDGGVYRVANILGHEGEDYTSMVVTLSPTYTIVKDSIIEIIAEVTTPSSTTAATTVSLGFSTIDKGETVDATRNSFVSVFDKTVRGVDSLYKGVLVTMNLGNSTGGNTTANVYTFDSSEGDVQAFGAMTFPTLEGNNKYYAWAVETSNNSSYLSSTLMVEPTFNSEGYIESVQAVLEDYTAGNLPSKILLGVLAKETNSIITNPGVYVSYKTQAPQTVYPLPSTIDLKVIECSPHMVLTSIGNGGGNRCPYFDNPLEQIPTFDKVSNQSFFFNLFGLKFNSFTEEGGHVTLPMRVCRHPGGVITLSGTGMDPMGRTYYTKSSENMTFKGESLSLGNPRKMVVPMLVKVVSDLVSPVLRGELLLALVSTYDNTTLANEILMGPNAGRSVMSLYKVPGFPVLK